MEASSTDLLDAYALEEIDLPWDLITYLITMTEDTIYTMTQTEKVTILSDDEGGTIASADTNRNLFLVERD